MKLQRHWLLRFLTLIVSLGICSSVSHAQQNGEVYRWDIVSIAFGSPNNIVTAGGVASATAFDGSKITVTGNGTFIIDQPPGLEGLNIGPRATGGGTWTVADSKGAVIGSGTYVTTGFVSYNRAPGTGAAVNIDNIGPGPGLAGTAVLNIRYSDGERGILIIGCHLVGTPDTVGEGISATKGFADFFNRQLPAPGVDANRTVYHRVQ